MRRYFNQEDIDGEERWSSRDNPPSIMRFSKDAWLNIKSTVGSLPAETGGMLLGDVKTGVVKRFVFDAGNNQRRTGSAYDPDVEFLNAHLDKARDEGLDLLGFMHSHPRGVSRLSNGYGNKGDVAYLKTIFSAMPEIAYLYTPIVFSTADGGAFDVFSYLATRGNAENYRRIPIQVEGVANPVPQGYQKRCKPTEQSRAKTPTSVNGLSSTPDMPEFAASILWQVTNNLGQADFLNVGGLYFGSESTGQVTQFVLEFSRAKNQYQPREEFWQQMQKDTDGTLLGIALVYDKNLSTQFVERHPAIELFARLFPDREYLFCSVLHKSTPEADMLLLLQRHGSAFRIIRHKERSLPTLVA